MASQRPRSFVLYISLLIIFCISTCRAQNNSTGAAGAGWPYHSYKTANFTPPELLIQKNGETDNGYLFMGPFGAHPTENAPLIMADNNDLIWNGPQGLNASAFGVQTYRNQSVLVYWTGVVFAEPLGRGYGTVRLFNSSYDQIAIVSLNDSSFVAQNGGKFPSAIDLHEVYITANDTLLVTANNVTQYDLSSLGGPTDGYITDALVYEIDIATNQVLFQWSALDHVEQIPLNLSQYPLGSEGYDGTSLNSSWGYFHINAVSSLPGGGYLISSRYLCSAIALDTKGVVDWILHGRLGVDFTLGNGTQFCFQHDIRAYQTNSSDPSSLTLTMHNNDNAPIDNGTNPTTGLELSVSLANHSTSLLRRLYNPKNLLYATAQGSYQPLSQNQPLYQNHVLLGHGFLPVTEEYNGTGFAVMTINFGPSTPGETVSYRAFRQNWTGCPQTKPIVATATENGGTAIYVSWNGATEVAGWNFYTGNNQTALKYVTSADRETFETRVVVQSAKYVQVQAVVKDEECAGIGDLMSDVVAV